MIPKIIANPFDRNSLLNAALWLILNVYALTNNQPHVIVWINLFGGNNNFYTLLILFKNDFI